MIREELIERMSIWINSKTISDETKAFKCADVAIEYLNNKTNNYDKI